MDKEIDKKLLSKNIKPTAMRQLVLEVFLKEKTAISVKEIEQEFELVDKSTIYRTIHHFEEMNLIHRINDGTGIIKYALCLDECTCTPEDEHIHYLCENCGKIYCLHHLSIPEFDLPSDFSFENVNIILKGICKSCKRA